MAEASKKQPRIKEKKKLLRSAIYSKLKNKGEENTQPKFFIYTGIDSKSTLNLTSYDSVYLLI